MLAPRPSVNPRAGRFTIAALFLVLFLSSVLWLGLIPGSSHVRTAATHGLGKILGSSPFGFTHTHSDDNEEHENDLPNPFLNITRDPRKDKVIVTGVTHAENVDWITNELSDWDSAIYSVDDPHSPLHTLENKGNEANPYLLYILEHYDDLPEIMVFLHPHKEDFWHADRVNNLEAVQRLNLNHVRQQSYAPLRCSLGLGCDGMHPDRNNPDEEQEYTFGQTWPLLFPDRPVPDTVAAPCCAQFAVTRDQVRARPREDYERFMDVLRYSHLSEHWLGRVFEYAWHIIFGKHPVL